MKAKEFVLSKYPTAIAYRHRYDNRLGFPTWCILDSTKGFNGVLFYNESGSLSESSAWTFAKKQIIETGKSNQQ